MQFAADKTNSELIPMILNRVYEPLFLAITLFLAYKVFKIGFIYLREKILLKKLSESGIKDIDRMDGLQFEVYLKSLFKEIGYRAQVTNGSHDFGADLIMKKDGKKIVVQAKRYGYKNKVSIDAVQQIYAAKAYYNANECWILTNSLFTKSALKLAAACNIKLYDRYKLVDLINKVNPPVTAIDVITTVEPETRKCPVCSGKLIQRKSKTGNYFMGCSNYPNCKHTERVAK